MASAKKSASSARSSSAKSAKKAAVKRGAAAKKAPAKKTPPKKTPAKKAPAKKTAAKATRTAAKKTATSHTRMPGNPSNWLPGKLVVEGDQIGVKTREGFVSLETLAANNEKLELVFGLNSGRPGGDASAPLQRLIEFIRSHSDDRVGIVVRCCVF